MWCVVSLTLLLLAGSVWAYTPHICTVEKGEVVCRPALPPSRHLPPPEPLMQQKSSSPPQKQRQDFTGRVTKIFDARTIGEGSHEEARGFPV
jgi:hypothetical protein